MTMGPPKSALKWHLEWILDRFSCFSKTWPTDTQTNRPRFSVCSSSSHLMQCIRWGL